MSWFVGVFIETTTSTLVAGVVTLGLLCGAALLIERFVNG